MKTKLPKSIKTIQQAKNFLKSLCDNNEHYHCEDDAHEIVGIDADNDERDQLNKLMQDIYELEGNSDHRHMAFDPCGFIIYYTDGDYKVRQAYDVFQDIVDSGPTTAALIELRDREDDKAMNKYLIDLARFIKGKKNEDEWKSILGDNGYELIQDIIKYEL